MAGQDAIWHVIIDGEQHGPLSRGDHKQWTLERDAGAGPHKPEYELLPVWDGEQRCFVWAIKETCSI